MKVIIIEDESIAAARLQKLLMETVADAEVAAILPGVKESVEWLRNNKADLIFADIQLSDGICFEIFDQVPVNTPLIFTTAYDQYTLRAFRLNSVAYLLKPINTNDLADSMKKFREMRSAFTPDLEQILMYLQGKEKEYRKRFLIHYGDKIRKVETDEIAYFYALEKNVFLKTFEGQDLPLDYTLDKLELMVDPESFFRINRKFIVNMSSIRNMTAWSRSRIKIDLYPVCAADEDVVVSIERSNDFRKWLNS